MRNIGLLFAALCCLLFASCDKDSLKAFVLDGTWTGYLESTYQDRWGVSGIAYKTAIKFVQETMYSGYGYEVDYNIDRPYDGYYYSEFSWNVSGGIITIHYHNGWNQVYIRDYTLNLATFRGRWIEGTREILFDFSPTSNFDWTPYQRNSRGTTTDTNHQ